MGTKHAIRNTRYASRDTIFHNYHIWYIAYVSHIDIDTQYFYPDVIKLIIAFFNANKLFFDINQRNLIRNKQLNKNQSFLKFWLSY